MVRQQARNNRQQEPVRHPIPILDRVLSAWEDFWFVFSLILTNPRLAFNFTDGTVDRPPLIGALINWQRFRRFLLGLHLTGKDPFARTTYEDFLPPEQLKPERPHLHFWFPVWLVGWSARSRRIYQVSDDLQLLLRATSLVGVYWKDVRFPFPAFALSLSKPIIGQSGEKFDFITVLSSPVEVNDNNERRDMVVIHAFPQKCFEYQPLTSQQKATLQVTAVNPKRLTWFKVNSAQMVNAAADILSGSLCLVIQDRNVGENTVLDSAGIAAVDTPLETGEDVLPNQIDLIEQVVRLVVGFVLYLKSLPPKSRHLSDPERQPLRSGLPDRRSIMAESEVCTVASVYDLTLEERAILGGEGEVVRRAQYELGWHFREGHWRRPPGQGDDPTAPRTVHVRPCIVRRDRMPDEGGLPSGAQKNVT